MRKARALCIILLMKIFTDIGGTFARFVQYEGGEFIQSKKYRAADFPTLEEALTQYCADHNLPIGGEIAIATAAYEDEQGDWRFVNQNKWVINANSLSKAGWTLTVILNDFSAATWGLLDLQDGEYKTIHEGMPSDRPWCLTGPGTGLGLGYLTKTKTGYHVQRTHGGHMLASPASEEQWQIIQTVQTITKTPVVFENLVSGFGLLNLYTALHTQAGQKPKATIPEDIMDDLDNELTRTALRLFHEFLGLHARSAVITGHAYGGLYLAGGVLKRLDQAGLFDHEHFYEFFTLPGVDSVSQDLKNTPINHFIASHLAMKGLLQYEIHNA